MHSSSRLQTSAERILLVAYVEPVTTNYSTCNMFLKFYKKEKRVDIINRLLYFRHEKVSHDYSIMTAQSNHRDTFSPYILFYICTILIIIIISAVKYYIHLMIVPLILNLSLIQYFALLDLKQQNKHSMWEFCISML